jgi:hypothetical protein
MKPFELSVESTASVFGLEEKGKQEARKKFAVYGVSMKETRAHSPYSSF